MKELRRHRPVQVHASACPTATSSCAASTAIPRATSRRTITAGARIAYVDEMRFVPVPNAATRRRGRDLRPVRLRRRAARRDRAAAQERQSAQPIVFKSFGWPLFFFNAKQGPLANAALRRAVLAALNFEDMLAAAFGSDRLLLLDRRHVSGGLRAAQRRRRGGYYKRRRSGRAPRRWRRRPATTASPSAS